MGETLNIPFLGKSSTTKEKIVFLLSSGQPLKTKQIYSELQKRYSLQITYQAVHKLLKQMEKENVIENRLGKHKLSDKWVNNLKNLVNSIGNGGSNESVSALRELDKPIHLKFNTIIEFGCFAINRYFLDFPNTEKKAGACIWEHVYSPIGVGKEEHENLKRIFRTPHYAISKYKTPLDEWFSSYFKKLGKHSLTGIDYPYSEDIFVQGAFVLKVYLPQDLRKEIHKLYTSIKEVKNLELAEQFEKVAAKKCTIHAVIIKDPELADMFRNEVLKHFKKNN